MKTSSAKAKARRLQNLLAEKLKETFPFLDADAIRPALMGETGMDIKLSIAARKHIPYAIEAKNRETLNVWESIKQAEANATVEGLTPAIAFSRNRLPEPYVAIPLSTFLRLIQPKSVMDTAGIDPYDDMMHRYDDMMHRSHTAIDKVTKR